MKKGGNRVGWVRREIFIQMGKQRTNSMDKVNFVESDDGDNERGQWVEDGIGF